MHPTLFHIGPLPIRAYGTMLVIGFLLALWRAMRVIEARNAAALPDSTPNAQRPTRITPDHVFDAGIGALLCGVIGARLLFVLMTFSDYAGKPISIVQLWNGGLSFHGGAAGGILWLWYYCRRKGIRFLELGDLAAPSFFIAYAFGRIGCYLNGCCYGRACSVPESLHWVAPYLRFRDGGTTLTPVSHPTQLYAVAFSIVFFLILRHWEKRPRRTGELFWAGLVMYNIYRFIVEFFRAGATSTGVLSGITDAQVASIVIGLIALYGWQRARRAPMPQTIPAAR